MTNLGLRDTSLPLEYLAEYDAAAQWCAEHGLLPANMNAAGALHWIQADPEAFAQRVRQMAYALAMERKGPL